MMESKEFIALWKTQNAKIDEVIAVNQALLERLTHQKAKNALRGLSNLKKAGIVSFVLYLLFLGYGLQYGLRHYSSDWNYFMVSVMAITLINIKGLADYIKHLNWVRAVNYDGSVVQIQQQLSKLKLSIVDHVKVMCLQFPFFTTFYLSSSWFPQNAGLFYVIFQIVLTGSFAYLPYWLFKTPNSELLNKKWFSSMIAGSGGKSVIKAIDFYKELEGFKTAL